MTIVSVTALASLTVVGGSAAASAEGSQQRPERASVTGSAEFRLPYVNDADIRSISFDAHAAPYSKPVPGVPTGLPTDAYGTVKVSHYSAERDTTYTAEGKVDCMTTAPGSATLTAVITKVSAGGPDWVGQRLGFSAHDGRADRPGKPSRDQGPDRVGFSWADGVNSTFDSDGQKEYPVGPCMAPAAFAPVTKGGYRVQHADLPLWPRNPSLPPAR
ncbi:hypothetical protein ITI46_14355 [Streptomyces oryzae]|uniref:Repetin n=1 Tax=Streptomyces oryzae TaxID=1434886 RepID=A0ABS3XBS7_9ACTN|nr:hypothetical protein [Streptomyces oryzae]MBO8192840.1 hypothetical protein [Streptomyces oryzae]